MICDFPSPPMFAPLLRCCPFAADAAAEYAAFHQQPYFHAAKMRYRFHAMSRQRTPRC